MAWYWENFSVVLQSVSSTTTTTTTTATATIIIMIITIMEKGSKQDCNWVLDKKLAHKKKI